LEEQRLLAAHRDGDPAALGTLLRGYQRRIYGVCARMVRGPEEAADLTQDALIRVIEGIDSYDGRAALSTWVIRVTMNCCLSHLRKEKLRRHASLDEPARGAEAGGSLGANLPDSAEPGPGGRVQSSEDRIRLLIALEGLDPASRAILVLRDLQELDYQQVGAVLDLPIGTVKSRLFRARAALREALERLETDEE
jgi:RNA polymerase sigma-70 factor (ECF subfamily)